MMDTITLNGREYRVEIEPDHDAGAPWEECDTYGPVTYWTRSAKAPGQRVLTQDRGAYRYYDFAEACRIAQRDGWSTADIEARKAGGEAVTRRQQAAEAAMRDFERLREWCNGEWYYCGVIVEGPDGEYTSLWGVESDADEHLQEVAQELAEELHAAYKQTKVYAYEG